MASARRRRCRSSAVRRPRLPPCLAARQNPGRRDCCRWRQGSPPDLLWRAPLDGRSGRQETARHFLLLLEHPMIFYPEERIAIFIDGANLYSAARGLAFDIDYRRLLELFCTKGRLIRAFYYTALVEDQEYSPIRPLVDWLDYNGYAMVTKPTKEFTDALGRRRIKGNMDIELAIDMLEMASYIDHAILFSGDGDFRRLVEAVQRKGGRVSVVSTIRSSPRTVA